METMTANTIQKMLVPNNNWKLLDDCRADEKDGRETLTFVNVKEGGVLEVTDGRILVQSKLDISCPVGVYKIIATNKYPKICYKTQTELTLESVDVKYPETAQVIPQDTEEKLSVLIQKKQVHACTIVKLFQFTGSAVSEKYLETIGELNTSWEITKTEKDRALMFYSQAYETKVVLMPLAMPK